MLKCPIKTLPEWQRLEETFGASAAMSAFVLNGSEIPSVENARQILSNDKKDLSKILLQKENKNIKLGVEELFDSNFLIFAEAKNADEVITKLINNNIIEKKCS
jgi:hypothetical protein